MVDEPGEDAAPGISLAATLQIAGAEMRSPPADERKRACDEARIDAANVVARSDEAHHHALPVTCGAASAPQCNAECVGGPPTFHSRPHTERGRAPLASVRESTQLMGFVFRERSIGLTPCGKLRARPGSVQLPSAHEPRPSSAQSPRLLDSFTY